MKDSVRNLKDLHRTLVYAKVLRKRISTAFNISDSESQKVNMYKKTSLLPSYLLVNYQLLLYLAIIKFSSSLDSFHTFISNSKNITKLLKNCTNSKNVTKLLNNCTAI